MDPVSFLVSASGSSARRSSPHHRDGSSTPTSISTTTSAGWPRPAPADHRVLLDLAEPIGMQSFDRARPLWEFTVVEGLADGRASRHPEAPPCDHRRCRRHQIGNGALRPRARTGRPGAHSRRPRMPSIRRRGASRSRRCNTSGAARSASRGAASGPRPEPGAGPPRTSGLSSSWPRLQAGCWLRRPRRTAR